MAIGSSLVESRQNVGGCGVASERLSAKANFGRTAWQVVLGDETPMSILCELRELDPVYQPDVGLPASQNIVMLFSPLGIFVGLPDVFVLNGLSLCWSQLVVGIVMGAIAVA